MTIKTTNPELAQIQVEGMTRSSFMVRSALTAGALYGTTAVGPFVTRALAQGGGDLDILNFALTLEYLEAAFYTEGVKKAGLSGENKKLAKQLRDDETAHVEALMKAIEGAGGKPVKAPGVDFGGATKNEKAFLKLAQVFEDTGVSAYNGAGKAISSPDVLAVAGSIVQIEARHAALIRLANKDTPAPDAFDKALTTEEVLKAVKPFIKA